MSGGQGNGTPIEDDGGGVMIAPKDLDRAERIFLQTF
jgi:hypothetical protein